MACLLFEWPVVEYDAIECAFQNLVCFFWLRERGIIS